MNQKRKIRIGGMMRCCIDTVNSFETHAAPDLVVSTGATLYCIHEGPYQEAPPILFRDGAWEWNGGKVQGHPLNERPVHDSAERS